MNKKGMTIKEKAITVIALAGLAILAGLAGGIDNERIEQKTAEHHCANAMLSQSAEVCR